MPSVVPALKYLCQSISKCCIVQIEVWSFIFLHRRAKDLVQSNIEILHKTANVLMEKEQIDGEEFQRIVAEAQAEQYLKPDADVDIPYREAQFANWSKCIWIFHWAIVLTVADKHLNLLYGLLIDIKQPKLTTNLQIKVDNSL